MTYMFQCNAFAETLYRGLGQAPSSVQGSKGRGLWGLRNKTNKKTPNKKPPKNPKKQGGHTLLSVTTWGQVWLNGQEGVWDAPS